MLSAYSSASEAWKSSFETTFRYIPETITTPLQKLSIEIGNTLQMKALSNKEQNTKFLVVSRLDGRFGFALPFFVWPIGRAIKMGARKIGGEK